MEFEWNQLKNIKNLKKHGIAFEDAVAVFFDPRRIERYDDVHSELEDRWITIGIANPNLLFVVFIIKECDKYRIISARKANERERREYGRI